ncbi:hypothetical protein TNCV_2814031 [Trichonephila clavipes]|nr:hypothetical protein TNCV_2814031 [Trichonephila clavipes]
MIPDMLDWRQVWGSGMLRKGSNDPCRVRPSIVLLKNGSWEPLHEWQHMWLQDVMHMPLGCHGATDWDYRVTMHFRQLHPISSHQLWERCVSVKQRQD